MTKLATVDSLRQELGFTTDMTDFTTAADDAMEAATVTLEAKLDTMFDRATVTDRFYVDEPPFAHGLNPVTEFRLSRGLVVAVSSFHYASLMAHFGTGDATDNLSVLMFNLDKGIVKDHTYFYDHKYVEITYTAGFEIDANYPDTYDANQVPKWLQQAARAQAKLFMSDNPTVKQAETNMDTRLIGSTLNQMLGRYVRYAPTALLPL